MANDEEDSGLMVDERGWSFVVVDLGQTRSGQCQLRNGRVGRQDIPCVHLA